MVELLRYFNDASSYPVAESKLELIRRIDEAVYEVKRSEKWRRAAMIYAINQRSAELNGMAKGRAEGMTQGIAKGIEQGIEQGIEKGRLEEKKDMVLSMLAENILPLSSIARIAKVQVSQIEEWRKEANR